MKTLEPNYSLFLKLLLVCISVLSISIVNAQSSEKFNSFFYKVGLATTLKVNEDFGSVEDYDDDEPFFVPSAFFLTNSLGFRFDRKLALEANLEFDWHSESGLLFAPAYLTLRHKLKSDETFFYRLSYGSLLKLGKSFEKGSLYKVGLGYWGSTSYTNTDKAALFGIEYTRKVFGSNNIDTLHSFSLFIEFSFF
jgi:hypothetical protein